MGKAEDWKDNGTVICNSSFCRRLVNMPLQGQLVPPSIVIRVVTLIIYCYGCAIFGRLRRRMSVMRMMIGSTLKKGLLKLYGMVMRLLSGRKRLEFQRRIRTT